MSQEFAGKTVIVTGATKGIGRATAKLLAARGATVVSMGRNEDELASLVAEIGGRAIAADLADPDEARRAAEEMLPADYLVNNAGMNILQPFLDISVDNFQTIQNVNLLAPLILSQAYARHRIAAGGGGAIVNVSSMSAFVGFADHAAYCAAKAGLDSMGRVMANELGPHGIRVNSINPIVTLTELAADAWSDPAKSGPMLARIPLGRFGEVDDIARIIAMLLGDDAAYMSGLAIATDGGFLTR